MKKIFLILFLFVIASLSYSENGLPEKLDAKSILLKYDPLKFSGSLYLENIFRSVDKNLYKKDINKLILKKSFIKKYFDLSAIIIIKNEKIINKDDGIDIKVNFFIEKETLQLTYQVMRTNSIVFFLDQIFKSFFKENIHTGIYKGLLTLTTSKFKEEFKGNYFDVIEEKENIIILVYGLDKIIEFGFDY